DFRVSTLFKKRQVPPEQQKAAPEQHSSCAGVSQFVAYALGKFHFGFAYVLGKFMSDFAYVLGKFYFGFAYVLGKFYFGFAYILGKKQYLCNTN
ncbi:hypothetical protein, partial [Leyella stercorea]|uniref:hypothetical protein n=1 Tax=Leyella stercorea TaxID=363265 RepID=UPI00242F64A8